MAKLHSLIEGLGTELKVLGMLPDWQPVRRKPLDNPCAGAKKTIGLPKYSKPKKEKYWDDMSQNWVPGGPSERF